MLRTQEVTPETPLRGAEEIYGQERAAAPFLRFLFLCLAFSLLGYAAAFPLLRSSAYLQWRQQQWGPMLDFAFNTGPRDADVVIFGDSSAFIGVDPRLIEAQLGLKTVVLPNTIGSLPITEDMSMRQYLRTHPKPRLLVLYFTAWDLDYRRVEDAALFEGEEMLFRHGKPWQVVTFALRHPFDTIVFPFRLYNTYGPGILDWLRHGNHAPPSLAPAEGHMDDRDDYPALRASCKITPDLLESNDAASVRSLQQKYAREMPVLVYLAPLPNCRGASTVEHRSYAALDAAPPAILPAQEIVGDKWFAHIEPPFVPSASRLLANAIAKRLGAADGQPTGTTEAR